MPTTTAREPLTPLVTDASVPAASAAIPDDDRHSAWASRCLNCAAALYGPFCSQCGQRAAPPHATLHELRGEAFSEFLGWDGKLVSTLKLLFTKPGELTRQFLDGRRAHFISPLRFYLSVSVVFFVLAARPPHSATPAQSTVTPAVTAAQQARREELLANAALAPALIRPLVRQVATNQAAFTQAVFDALGKAVFAMLPVFAGILALFYRRRHFADHLYFSIHLHAFFFAALDASLLIKYLRMPVLSIAAATLSLIWIPVYTHLALRRVYGGTHVVLALQELGISALYAVASVPVIGALAVWVAWTMG